MSVVRCIKITHVNLCWVKAKEFFSQKNPFVFTQHRVTRVFLDVTKLPSPRAHRGVLLTPLTIWHGQVRLKVSVLYSNN